MSDKELRQRLARANWHNLHVMLCNGDRHISLAALREMIRRQR